MLLFHKEVVFKAFPRLLENCREKVCDDTHAITNNTTIRALEIKRFFIHNNYIKDFVCTWCFVLGTRYLLLGTIYGTHCTFLNLSYKVYIGVAVLAIALPKACNFSRYNKNPTCNG